MTPETEADLDMDLESRIRGAVPQLHTVNQESRAEDCMG